MLEQSKYQSAPGDTNECTICFESLRGKQRVKPGGCSKATCILCYECVKRICMGFLKKGRPCTCPFDRIPFSEVFLLGKKGEFLEEIPVEELLHDPTLCKVCKKDHDQKRILECVWCDYGFHMQCLSPPMEYYPEGNWSCPPCTRKLGTPSTSTEYEFPTTTQRRLSFTLLESPYTLDYFEQDETVQETPQHDDQAAASLESSSTDVVGRIMNFIDGLSSSRIINNPPISEPTVSSSNDAYNPQGAHNVEETVVKEKDKKKSASFQRQQQIIYEVKLALEPSYHRGEITKDDFKQITKKSVEKIEKASRQVDRAAVRELVKGYLPLPLQSSFKQKSVSHLRIRYEQIRDEVKLALKAYFRRGEITTHEYKEIMQKSVEKIKKTGDVVDRYAVGRMAEEYVFQCLAAKRPSGKARGKQSDTVVGSGVVDFNSTMWANPRAAGPHEVPDPRSTIIYSM